MHIPSLTTVTTISYTKIWKHQRNHRASPGRSFCTVIISLFMGAQSPDRFMQLTAALLSCEYRLTLAIMKCRVINMFIALLTLFLRVGGTLAMRNWWLLLNTCVHWFETVLLFLNTKSKYFSHNFRCLLHPWPKEKGGNLKTGSMAKIGFFW